MFLGHPAWIGEWVMLDCEADWIQCAGRLVDHQELWKMSEITSFFMESPLAIFPDKYCMNCLRRNGWKDHTVMLFQGVYSTFASSSRRKSLQSTDRVEKQDAFLETRRRSCWRDFWSFINDLVKMKRILDHKRSESCFIVVIIN